MKFGKVIQLILMFYNLAIKHADEVAGGGGGAGYGAYLALHDNGTFEIRTGRAADKTLSGEYENDTLELTFTTV